MDSPLGGAAGPQRLFQELRMQKDLALMAFCDSQSMQEVCEKVLNEAVVP